MPGEFFSGTALLHRREIHAIIRLKAGSAYHTERIENMNHIGQRIRELRRKNDLTQEKMADYLGVTYQSVSKWECGTTYPDPAMIVPIARLLHVTADELLGMDAPENDERKAYFDGEYVEFWKKDDHEADYRIAQQAVAEYPDDLRYRHWLGTLEYYICFSRTTHEEFIAMADSSIRNNLMVWENSDDMDLRKLALWDIICAYKYSGRTEEAKKYARLYPETYPGQSDPMEICLEGEELLTHLQEKFLYILSLLCVQLEKMWIFGDPSDPLVSAYVHAEKTIIEAVISDENYLQFHSDLQDIHAKLADIALVRNVFDTAVRELEQAMHHAKSASAARVSGKQLYTCPLLSHCDYNYSDSRPLAPNEVYLKERLLEKDIYAPLRGRDDFKALFQ